MNIIQELLKQTDEAETPRTWIRFAALMSISAVTSFNVYLDKFYYKLTPNVYALLIGKSGLGKALPVYISKQLVEESTTQELSLAGTVSKRSSWNCPHKEPRKQANDCR